MGRVGITYAINSGDTLTPLGKAWKLIGLRQKIDCRHHIATPIYSAQELIKFRVDDGLGGRGATSTKELRPIEQTI